MPRKKKEYLSPVELKCTQCVYKTKNRSDLRRHERRHKDVKFPCDVCNMPFMTLGHLGAHRRSVHNMKEDKPAGKVTYRQFCDQCDYTTIYSSDMARHRRKHDVNQHHCPICNYPFGHITTLTVHIKKYHGKDQTETLTNGSEKDEAIEGRKVESKRIEQRTNKLYKSDQIKKRIHNRESRIGHAMTTDKVEKTPSREKLNNRPTDMSEDEQKHTDEVPETVSTSSLLQLILRNKDSTKENTKKHSKTSIKKSNDSTTARKQLQSPKKADNKTNRSKIFNCNRCEFATKMEETFRRHTNRHDRGKFRCESCGMPFLFKVNLDKHVETKHADVSESDSSFDTTTINSSTPIKCDTCQFVTFSYNQFQAHKEDHATNPETNSETGVSLKPNHKENHAPFSESDESAKHNHKKVHTATCETDQSAKQDYADDDVGSDISLESEYPGPDFSLETGNESIDTGNHKNYDCITNGVQTKEVGHEKISSVPTHSLIVSDKTKEEDEACNKESIEEDSNLVEDYHCKHCTYVTSDKKFIKLHMSMHGSEYMAPKKGNASKKYKKAKDLGYEIRLRRLDNKQTLNRKDRKVSKVRRGPIDNEMKSTMEQNEISSSNAPHAITRNGKIADQVNSEKEIQKEKLDKPQTDIRGKSETSTKARGDGIKSIAESVDKPLLDLVGVLTKEDFKRTKTFYTEEHTDSGDKYGCKLCADVGEFETKMDLYNHFKLNHQILREKICATCKYCNGPFPVLK